MRGSTRARARPLPLHGQAGQRFTHQRDAAFTPADVAAVRRGFDVLADAGRLGAVLVQFPRSFKRDEANREWLGDVARAFGADGAAYPLVLEVRHASWNVPAFYDGLAARGIGFVNVDRPLFAKSMAMVTGAPAAAPPRPLTPPPSSTPRSCAPVRSA